MTGLDLEQFLRLLRLDSSLWLSVGGGLGLIVLIVWAGRGKRRVLQRCLALSLLLHTGLVVYGGPQAVRWLSDPADLANTLSNKPDRRPSDSRVQLLSEQPGVLDEAAPRDARDGAASGLASALNAISDDVPPLLDEPIAFDRSRPPVDSLPQPRQAVPAEELTRVDPVAPVPPELAPLENDRPTLDTPVVPPEPVALADLRPMSVEPIAIRDDLPAMPDPALNDRDRRASAPPVNFARSAMGLAASRLDQDRLPADTSTTRRDVIYEGSPPAYDGPLLSDSDLGRGASMPISTEVETATLALPDAGPRRAAVGRVAAPALAFADRRAPVPLGLKPISPDSVGGGLAPPIPIPAGRPATGRPLPEIPSVYRSRFAPNRSALALRAGATPASEEAVGRALAWLARHQDADGRWNAGSRPGPNGWPAPGETSFLAHCPPGELCAGESEYWGADNAMTGLALLAFMGAGHTHQSGPYEANLRRGVDFLLNAQGIDGDLRGPSRGFGIYCHAIATLALCEAYALTGDERLRRPVERALRFLVEARAADRLSWRYEPGDRFGGDTSILGWAVMVAKSAREIGLDVPADVGRGAKVWLDRVSDGKAGGLAMYRPPGYSDGGKVTPTMTAEAWVCRQFLGFGGPGRSSDEAAAYLLAHGPDRDPFNLYYWYYATLAMYQHGGPAWTRWNERVRDQLVGRQVRGGHADGSWDPALCKDPYDSKGGRIYATALAALTLEVYYRYLKLYDAPPDDNTDRIDPGLAFP